MQVVKGTDVILNIEKTKTDRNDKPLGETSPLDYMNDYNKACWNMLVYRARPASDL